MAVDDSNWSWVVSAACFLSMFSVVGLFRSSGVLFTSLINIFGITREEATWPFSLACTVGLLVAVVNGILCHILTVRTITFCATLLSSIGIALCYTSNSITTITIYYGVIYGTGIGIVSLCNLIIICQYFDKYKTIATGIAYSGTAVGAFVLPPLLEYLLEAYGLRGTFLSASAIILQGLVAAALFRPKQVSSKEVNTECGRSPVLNILYLWVTIFKYPAFYLIWISYLVFHFIYFMFPTVVVDYASDLRIDTNTSVYLLSAYSIADLCGRLSCGWITDVKSVKRKYVVAIGFIGQCLILSIIPLSAAYVFLIIVSIASGFLTGCLMINWSPLLAEYLGITNLPSAMGTMFTLSGLLPFCYPSIVGYYRDVKGNYNLLFYSCAVSQLLVGILWFLEPYIIKRSKKEESLPQ